MNDYATLSAVKADLGIAVSTHDAILSGFIEASSRGIDRFCHRHFFVETKTRWFTPRWSTAVLFDDDLLSVTALTTDSEADGTYDGETWVEDTDFWLVPYANFPKSRAEITAFGNFAFSNVRRNVQVVGEWGYGDGTDATPYTLSALTATVADASTTTLTASADATSLIFAGQTLLVGLEKMYVSVVSDVTVTVTRAVNGTTAAEHDALSAINIYDYPAGIKRMCSWLAGSEFKQRNTQGMAQERMGDYFYTKLATEVSEQQRRVLSPYQRRIAA